MIPLWQPGCAPSGKGRILLLREIRGRIAATGPLGDGFYLPWTELREYGGTLFLIGGGPAASIEKSRVWSAGLCRDARVGLAKSLVRTMATFEKHGLRLGMVRPETIIRHKDRFYLQDPVIFDLLRPFRPEEADCSRLNFLAPEIAAGWTPSPAADLFALGATLYWLFAGRLPFDDADERYIADHLLNRSPLDPRFYLPSLPAPFAAAVLALLDRRPEARPAAVTLDRTLAAVPVADPDGQRYWCRARRRPPRLDRPRRRPWRILAGAAAALFLVFSLGIWRLASHRRPYPPATLGTADQAVTLLYRARNDLDYATLSTLVVPGIDLKLPSTANSAIWENITAKKVQPGVRPGSAQAVVNLEEISLVRGVITRWTGTEIIDLAVRRGRWRITGLTRINSGPLKADFADYVETG